MDHVLLKHLLEESIEGRRHELFTPVIESIHCMSTARVYSILNACVSSMQEGEVYVEVGTYQGGSLISAMLNNNAKAIGVDSFSEFKETNSYALTKQNLERFGVLDRVDLRDSSFEEFFASLPDDFVIQVYYYDGAHDFVTQLAGMEAAWKHLIPGSIILVDDLSYIEVTRAVNQFICNHPSNIKIKFTLLPEQGPDKTWWNGVCVLEVF